MFEKITIDSKNRLRLGSLCESLLFYGKTVLLIDYGSLPTLLKIAGIDALKDLVQSGDLEIYVNETSLGGGHFGGNNFRFGAWSGDRGSKQSAINHAIEEAYPDFIGNTSFYDVIDSIVKVHRYDQNYSDYLKSQMTDATRFGAAVEIASNGKLTANQVKASIINVSPGVFNIQSSIGEELINKAGFLITTGTAEIFNATRYSSALSLQPDSSNYCEFSLEDIIQKSKLNKAEIDLFHEEVLPEYFDISGTMESQVRSFKDFMDVWYESKKFKDWVANEEVDNKLLQAYIERISKVGWIDKLPSKTARFIIFTGASAVLGVSLGTVAGIIADAGLNAFDAFVLDKLINKWKPDQFVEGDYKDLLKLRK